MLCSENGTKPWIYRKDTGTLILCGDLIEAVKTESALDIMRMYGIESAATVAKWRKHLGVDRQNNAGTQRLYKELKPIKLPEEVVKRGREAAARKLREKNQ